MIASDYWMIAIGALLLFAFFGACISIGREYDRTEKGIRKQTAQMEAAMRKRQAEHEARMKRATRTDPVPIGRGGYTGGKSAEEMGPPPTDLPSLALPPEDHLPRLGQIITVTRISGTGAGNYRVTGIGKGGPGAYTYDLEPVEEAGDSARA